jgi:Xaa-Pro aminopeptidase
MGAVDAGGQPSCRWGRDVFEDRLSSFREVLAVEELGAFLTVGPSNIRYLTGFPGCMPNQNEVILLVTQNELFLIADYVSRGQAAECAPIAKLVERAQGKLVESVPPLLGDAGGRLGLESANVESASLTLNQWSWLAGQLGPWEPVFVQGLVERLRVVKTPEEVQAIRESCDIITEMMRRLRETPVVGRTERDVAYQLEAWAHELGSGPFSFPFMVGAGVHSSQPHSTLTDQPVPSGTLMIVDVGTTVDGYVSDITRTFATGFLTDEQLELYALVQEAQAAGLAAVRPGAVCADVDAAARAVIASADKGEFYGHDLGHGLGMYIHEAPRVGPGSECDEVLQENMLLTVEPGVYLGGRFGARIEDSVLVTSAGAEILTPFTKELVTLC